MQWEVKFEKRDVWIGLYWNYSSIDFGTSWIRRISRLDLYICPLPLPTSLLLASRTVSQNKGYIVMTYTYKQSKDGVIAIQKDDAGRILRESKPKKSRRAAIIDLARRKKL